MAVTVGFIGVGNMGNPMAANVLKAFPMTVFDMNAKAMENLIQAGAKRAGSPREVVESSEIVFTSLPASPDVEAVYLEPGGLVDRATHGDIDRFLDQTFASEHGWMPTSPDDGYRWARALRCTRYPERVGDRCAREHRDPDAQGIADVRKKRTFGVPVEEFVNAVMMGLREGEREIAYGFSQRASQASRPDLDEIFLEPVPRNDPELRARVRARYGPNQLGQPSGPT